MDYKQFERDLKSSYKAGEHLNIEERSSALLKHAQKEWDITPENMTQNELKIITSIIMEVETKTLHDEVDELLAQKERIERQLEKRSDAFQLAKYDTFDAIESALSSSPSQTLNLLHQIRLESIDLYDMLSEMSESAIITALEKNEELEETIKGAIEEITTHTLNEKTPNTLRVKSILTTILSSAAYIADATPNSATEILRGTLRGIRIGLTKSIHKFNKQLQYMPNEAKMILIDDYASLEQELNNIDGLFNSIISDVSSQSSSMIQNILDQINRDMKFDMDKLIQAASETAETMKERFSDIKYDALQQSSKVMNSKTAKEAKRMGIYAWSVAKSAIDGAIKGAKEKMDKER
ncbi:MAG: DUF6781 family protein [Campylobacterota bacterium]|nr:DUF6781 family protein [Campylobacterota bacterium]